MAGQKRRSSTCWPSLALGVTEEPAVVVRSPREVASWFPTELRPDETWSGFADETYEPYAVPAGVQPMACWWD